jgi:hypothetical protein
MHPFVGDLSQMKDGEIESKIHELTKKYFITSNPEVRSQIVTFLDTYKEEMRSRQAKLWQAQQAQINNGLDKLIKVN